jgi:hypothetical protein
MQQEPVITLDMIAIDVLKQLDCEDASMLIDKDAVEMLAGGVEEFLNERLWLMDKICRFNGDTTLSVTHLNKLEDAFFVVDEEEKVPMILDDAEEDDEEMILKLKIFNERKNTMMGPRNKHRQLVGNDIMSIRKRVARIEQITADIKRPSPDSVKKQPKRSLQIKTLF